MTRFRRLPWLLLALSVAANVGLAALLLDGGFQLDDARTTAELLAQRRELALELLREGWVGRPAARVDELAAKLKARGVVVGVEDGDREIGDFVFVVRDGVVVDVRDFDSPSVEVGRAGLEPATR